jgi:hypothetical protein
MYTLNLAQMPFGTSIEFLQWVFDRKIGNYLQLMVLVATDPDWYKQESIPFECSEKEATFVVLRWSS